MIRKSRESDCEKLKDIYKISSLSAYSRFVHTTLLVDYLLEMYNDKTVFVGKEEIYCFVEKDEVVGFIEILNSSGNMEITKLYVFPEFKGLGIGTKLIQFIDKKAFEYQKKFQNLWVLEKNEEGRKFYDRKGYTQTNSRKFLERYKEYQVEYIKEIRLTKSSSVCHEKAP